MTHRSASLPPEVAAWLVDQPPAEQAALKQAWTAAAPVSARPAPDAERIEQLWQQLAIATAPPAVPDDVRAGLTHLAEEERAGLDEVWQLASALPPPAAPAPNPARIDALWAAIDPAPAAPADHQTGGAARRPPRAQDRAPRAAAPRRVRWATGLVALLLVAAVSVTLWLRPTTLEAPLGEMVTATLPDGSTVTLNSGTELQYDRHFGDGHRDLVLRGEGFFEVMESDEPFRVETFNAVVTVLGTEFNVRGWPEGGTRETMVSVVSGRVQVAARMIDTASVDLTAGQIGWVQHETSPLLFTNANVRDQIAWLSGDFIFDGARLDLIFEEIERRFDIRIVASSNIRSLPMNINKYGVTQPEVLLDAICQTHGLSYRATERGYEIYRP